MINASRFKGFYARSSLFTLFSLTSAVFSYALYPALVRVLSPREFGDFAAVMAVIGQTMAVLAAVNVVSVYLVKSYGEAEARSKVQAIQKILIWLFLGLTLVVMLLSPILGHFLKIHGASMFLVLGLMLVLSIPISLWTGYLQGNKELVRVGVFTLLSTIAKLIFAVILAVLLGPLGALLGVLLGAVVGIIVIKVYPGVKLPRLGTNLGGITAEERLFLTKTKTYILECIFVVGSLGVLQNIDITFAKILFKPDIAGVYSGVSIVSNALYYLCFVLLWIVIPEIDIKNQKINKRVLGTAYKLIGVLTVGVLAGEYLLRDFLTKLLLGSNFSGQGAILLFASLYQLTLASIVLYAFYLLVCRKSQGFLLAALVLTCSLSFAILWHDTPLVMIRSLWFSLVIAVIVYTGSQRLIFRKIRSQ